MKGIQTAVKNVRIFRNGAIVRRQGKAELSAGDNQLLIAGASGSADFNTVRLYFPAGIRMSDLRFTYPKDEDKESTAVQEEIEELEKAIETYELQIQLWKENGVFTSRQDLDTQQIENYIGELPERLSALRKKITETKHALTKLRKRLDDLSRKEDDPLLSVRVCSEQEMTCDFEYVYHENNAGWQPVNEVHADPGQPVVLKSRARISQNTGEEWKDVAIALLSGNPSAYSDLPELGPLYLRIRTNTRVSAPRMMMANGAATAKLTKMELLDDAAEASDELCEADTEEAAVSTEETMTEYVLPGTKTIPCSEGTMADLQSYTLPCEYEIVAVPKMDIRAYMTAKIKTEDLPASFNGRTELYLKDVYAGSTYLAPDSTKKEFVFSLGREEAIQVSRTEKKRKTSEAMLMNSKNTEYSYELKITNGKDSEQTVIVRDQIPVSQDKTITVELLESNGAEKDEKDGMLTWKLQLAPKETKTLTLSYKVTWPKGKNISETTVGNRFCPACGARVSGSFCPECGTPIG
ncbi:MAG: mucoidy inhibitor MuiA family protein [Erysipelotrichaceae bacterium]|nr:mucoidy inhibitor MuiA family protein [Erysipelotrichaceae bacterium]